MAHQPPVGTEEIRIAQIRVLAEGLQVSHDRLGQIGRALSQITAYQETQPEADGLGPQGALIVVEKRQSASRDGLTEHTVRCLAV